ncbi:MAG TPA: deoxyuridine 5'-triphosphate nucleotidohydrolase [Chloroflexota bacterium]|nr:deoxyuridine 5'-triphosphate nucleotidohydrolase [Chloroflexota bacterium]
MSGVLGRAALLTRLADEPPLVRGLADPARQVQPHGIDLRLESVWALTEAGAIEADPSPAGGSRSDRRLPSRAPVPFGPDGRVHLAPGAYLVRFVESVHLPADLMALGRPRSTLLRCGAALHTAVWDAGYAGRSEALLAVSNPHGVWLAQGARLLQLVFFRVEAPGTTYAGAYQGENLPPA